MWVLLTVIMSFIGLAIRMKINEYIDVDMPETDQKYFKTEYELLYRAKQHAQRCGKFGIITDPLYFKLEQSLLSCRKQGDVGSMEPCIQAFMALNLLDKPARSEKLRGIIKMGTNFLQKIILPQRQLIEKHGIGARTLLKKEIMDILLYLH